MDIKKIVCNAWGSRGEVEVGYLQEIKWIRVGWDGGPKNPGEYLVITNDGETKRLMFSGSDMSHHDKEWTPLELFYMWVYESEGGNELTADYLTPDGAWEPMTADRWVSILREERPIWYTLDIGDARDRYGEYSGQSVDIGIYPAPKYYLSIPIDKLTLPIDSEKVYEIMYLRELEEKDGPV